MHHLALIGYGNVGRALAGWLRARREPLRRQYGIEWRITGLATRRLGWLADTDGIDPDAPEGDLIEPPGVEPADVAAWLRAARADVLFEMSPLAPETGEPATSYLRAALAAGVPVVSANKGPLVHAYRELRDLAAAHGVHYRFEAAFMGGAPIYSLFRETRPLTRLLGFRGLLNSTTSIILAGMEEGRPFAESVKLAQELGVAETDPGADIDGWDAAVKAACLANVLMDAELPLAAVQRTGIRGLTTAEVQAARAAGTPIRLVTRLARAGDRVTATVGPEPLPPGDPLAGATGTTLVAHFELDTAPGLTITAHGADNRSTAYDMLADFIAIVRSDTR